ncbi:hypothetical protein MJH12_08770, partial [bacterium]|nr:hypothetical protein [bacterium]
MRFLVLIAILYFSALYYQNSLMNPVQIKSEQDVASETIRTRNYASYVDVSKDIFFVHSLKSSLHQS